MIDDSNQNAERFIKLAPRSRSRFICTICNEYTRPTNEKSRLLEHVKNHLREIHWSRINPPLLAARADQNIDDNQYLEAEEGDFSAIGNRPKMFQCILDGCTCLFRTTSELNRHERTHQAVDHSTLFLKSSLIDEEEGICFVRSTLKGQDFKVHVNVKSGECSNSDCSSIKTDESLLICRHVRSARSGRFIDCEFHKLTEELIENSRFSLDKKNALKHIQEAADAYMKPMIAESSESKESTRHFSVFASKTERAYVKLVSSRSLTHSENWKCDSCPREINSNCVHIHAAMCIAHCESRPNLNHLERDDMIRKYYEYARYIFINKRIPRSAGPKPMILQPGGDNINMVLEPSETTCPICPDNCILEYSPRSQMNSILLCVEGTQSIRVKTKQCPNCKLKVSYKDSDKFVFNFNDNLIISHRLLERWGNHIHSSPVTISEMYNAYKKEFGVKCKDQDVRNAFNSYFNLIEENSVFKCVICKECPEVLIFDGNAKLRCSLDFNRDIDKNIEGLRGEVNVQEFWDENSISIILRMFGINNSRIDFKMAPIIDSSVAGDIVFNTEYSKLNPILNVQQSGHKELTVDQLRDLCLKKLTNSELKSACNGLNINTPNGLSIEDLRSLLIKHFEAGLVSGNRDSSSIEMNKLFPSYNHSNGGFLFGLCEHGIVYYSKFLVRGEGSRDVLDAILSFKNAPKYVIYDDAGRLAEHAFKRLSLEKYQSLIGANKGRVLPESEESINRAKEALKGPRKHLVDRGPGSGMLILYDRFHQNNSKNPNAILRFMDLVGRLKSVNSQHAEELNRIIRGFSRSLNMCSPTLSFNMLKRIISAMNIENNSRISSIKKRQYGSVED